MNFNEVNNKLTNSKHGGGSLNNKNNASSRKYLIVFGIFALVIVTTAASFAFFTYSRTSLTTTTVTSGDIEFTYKEGADAGLANAFPVSDTVGAQDTSEEYTFHVNMKSTANKVKMNYDVYLVSNNPEGADTKYFTNDQIKFSLVKNETYVAGTSKNLGLKLSSIDGFDEEKSTGEGLVLDNQYIESEQTDNYKLRIWISDDVSYTNITGNDGTMDGKYNSYTYSLKVKVEAEVGNTIQITEPEVVGRTIVANLEDTNGISAYGVSQAQDPATVTEWIPVTNDETAKSGVIRTASGNVVTSKTIQHKVNSYGTYYVHVKNTLDEITSKKVDVKVKEISTDRSGAATPVIKGDLVPVIMNGSDVIKADTSKNWYNYDASIWANAVILNDGYGPYENGVQIPEEAIESYFVWIPRYEYKIFDEKAGNYTTFTDKGSRKQEIEIKFVTKNDAVKNGDSFGTWLTHPAFTSFDTNGMWVGKFESGYRGATTNVEANKNLNDSSKLIIKPNVYSWRSIQVANAYQTSFNYERGLDSHMMKNTEWGAVVYLSHSKYGNMDSVRINNNYVYITGYSAVEEPTLGINTNTESIPENRHELTIPGNDGQYTINYLNIKSVLSSTTGNYSGIYDMSGGAFEYVMAVVADANEKPLSGLHNVSNSGFKGTYSCPTCSSSSSNPAYDSSITENTTGISFPEDDKYYDLYLQSQNRMNYTNRILGDATGEMGPFYAENDPDKAGRGKSYWYEDLSNFIDDGLPWFIRGGSRVYGSSAGLFAFGNLFGNANGDAGFRVVLTPEQ